MSGRIELCVWGVQRLGTFWTIIGELNNNAEVMANIAAISSQNLSLPKTKDYISHFDPEWYLKKYYSAAESSVEGLIAKFFIDTFHKIFRKGKYRIVRLLLYFKDKYKWTCSVFIRFFFNLLIDWLIYLFIIDYLLA